MLIGFHGEAGSGKDTAGAIVVDYITSLRMPARRDGFADRLKVSAARALGYLEGTPEDAIALMNILKACGSVTAEIEHGPDDIQEVRISGREYFQYYGTEAHRDVFGYDFWVDAVLDKYDGHETLVVTDVRFANEARAVREHGPVWEIVRPDNKIKESAHASEAGLPPELIDYTFVNDGTIEDLRAKIIKKVDEQLISYQKVAA